MVTSNSAFSMSALRSASLSLGSDGITKPKLHPDVDESWLKCVTHLVRFHRSLSPQLFNGYMSTNRVSLPSGAICSVALDPIFIPEQYPWSIRSSMLMYSI